MADRRECSGDNRGIQEDTRTCRPFASNERDTEKQFGYKSSLDGQRNIGCLGLEWQSGYVGIVTFQPGQSKSTRPMILCDTHNPCWVEFVKL